MSKWVSYTPYNWSYQFLPNWSSWWLNQPIWKICSSNWIISPGRDGNKKSLSCHHPMVFGAHLGAVLPIFSTPQLPSPVPARFVVSVLQCPGKRRVRRLHATFPEVSQGKKTPRFGVATPQNTKDGSDDAGIWYLRDPLLKSSSWSCHHRHHPFWGTVFAFVGSFWISITRY